MEGIPATEFVFSKLILFSVLLRSFTKFVVPSATGAVLIDVAEVLTVLSRRSILPALAPTADISLADVSDTPIPRLVAFKLVTSSIAGSRSPFLRPRVDIIIAAIMGIPIIRGNHHHQSPLLLVAVSSTSSGAAKLSFTSAITILPFGSIEIV